MFKKLLVFTPACFIVIQPFETWLLVLQLLPQKTTNYLALVNDQLDAQFFYFIIRLLSPLNVSSNVVLVIRRSNCINTASGIVTLYKWPSGAPDGHLLLYYSPVHVSSNVMIVIRRLNYINTVSGIVTLCKWPSGAQVERELSQPVHRMTTYRQ